MTEHDFHETPNMYSNPSTSPSNGQQFRLNKINEIKDLLNILLLLSILINR